MNRRPITEDDMTVMVRSDVQDLIDNGTAWRMEGAVGRECMRAIETGDAVLPTVSFEDAYGNVVPARHHLKEGTKGTVAYAYAIQMGWN